MNIAECKVTSSKNQLPSNNNSNNSNNNNNNSKTTKVKGASSVPTVKQGLKYQLL